jgi:hypothetical protein
MTTALIRTHANVMNAGEFSARAVPAPAELCDCLPSQAKLMCAVNGVYYSSAAWQDITLCQGDTVDIYVLPEGGDGGSVQQVLGLVLLVAGVYTANPYLMASGAALLATGLIEPPTVAPILSEATDRSPTYNVQLSGNAARLGRPFPISYGRHPLVPDFASQPYYSYDGESNQFYHALLSLGPMEAGAVLSITLDDTELSHFVDVQTQLIGPAFGGGTLTLVDPAVVTAPEVTGQELIFGTYHGPVTACGPGLAAWKIEIDIVFPRGLYFASSTGALEEKTASWTVEARSVTDTGAAAGAWFLLGFESLTAATNSTIRRTYSYLVSDGRYEVRTQRQDEKDANARAAHDVSWASLRAFLRVDQPLDPDVNFLALRMKATNQLSSFSQNKIEVLLDRYLRKWHPSTGWSSYVSTANPAWVSADILRNQKYGGRIPEDRIDLQTLYELSLVWDARGDAFNGIFDSWQSVWQATSTVLRVGRARPLLRGGRFTAIRDAEQTLPKALFTLRNIAKDSFSISYSMVQDDEPDGVEVAFFNETTWATDYVTKPMPGQEAEPVSPLQYPLHGVTRRLQAERIALTLAAELAYRRQRIAFTTELEGLLPAFGDLVAVAYDLPGWGASGEIESWDGSTAICSEDLVWADGQHYAMLRTEQGDAMGPYRIAPGSAPRSMLFIDAPDFTPYDGLDKERTLYSMGPAERHVKLCKLTGIKPGPNYTVALSGFVDDARVYTAELAAGGPGGPGGGTGGVRTARYAPDGLLSFDAASDEERASYGYFTRTDLTIGVDNEPGYVYAP